MNKRRPQIVEFALWVAVVACGVIVGSIVIGFVIGGGLLTSKYIMFIAGFLMVGLGVLGMQPTSPYKDEKRISVEGDSETRLESAVNDLPPIDDVTI
ncbi:MAG: hypothetical protein ABEI86_03650, partial [Halobacteriaceae archaeon]